MIAYLDDFWMMAWVTLAAAPLVIFMRKPDLRRTAPVPGEKAPPPDIPH